MYLPETLVKESKLDRLACRREGNITVYVRDIGCQEFTGFN